MRRKMLLHIVDHDVKRRAAVSHLAFTAGYHAEIHLSVDNLADREPLVASNPHDPRNRRISILLLD